MTSGSYVRELRSAGGDPVRWAFLVGVQLLRAGRASLLLRSGDGRFFDVAVSVGIDETAVEGIRVEIGRGIAGIVADRGVGLSGSKDDMAFMSVPVMSPRGVIGVFNVTDRWGGGSYSDEDIALARSIADHVATLLEYSSYEAHDPVTHLLNATSFTEALEQELARSKRMGSSCTVGVVAFGGALDLGSFSGATERDDRLRLLADACKGHVRRYDVVGRLSDDTFALLLPDAAAAGPSVTARLQELAGEIYRPVDIALRIRVGLARCPVDGVTVDELMERVRARLDGKETVAS
jgi:diguanylate cyclase (GGDEF)-like protein